jgi:hypothetical protein
MRGWVREAEGGGAEAVWALLSARSLLGQRDAADAAAVVVALCFLPLLPGLLCSGDLVSAARFALGGF